MSTPKKAAPKAPTTVPGKSQVRQQPTPMRHGGQPAGGKHVPSNVAGHAGPFDSSQGIGSNIAPMAGGASAASPEVLEASPGYSTYPDAQMDAAPGY